MLPQESEIQCTLKSNQVLNPNSSDSSNNCTLDVKVFDQLKRKSYSLLILQKESELLLGYKKRGFGLGKWNGFGGKLEDGEGPVTAAVREMKEESGIEVNENDLEKIGLLEFTFVGKTILMEVHIFRAFKFTGIPTESDEMIPKWFSIESLPFDSMWLDDRIWYPLMLEGKKFKGHVRFDEKEEIVYDTIKTVDCLD